MMYTSESQRGKNQKSGKLQLIFGIIGTVLFGFGLIGGINDSSLRQHWVAYSVLILPFIWMLYQSIHKQFLINTARRYDGLFQSDKDGIIPIQLLATQIGKTVDQVSKELDRLMQKGYLQNCTLTHDSQPRIILSQSAIGSASVNTKTTICPNCGSSNVKREGFECHCAYCGSPLE